MKLRFIPGISDSVPGAYMTHCRACVFGQKQMDDRPTVLASSTLILTGEVETGRTRFGKILIKLCFFSARSDGTFIPELVFGGRYSTATGCDSTHKDRKDRVIAPRGSLDVFFYFRVSHADKMQINRFKCRA